MRSRPVQHIHLRSWHPPAYSTGALASWLNRWLSPCSCRLRSSVSALHRRRASHPAPRLRGQAHLAGGAPHLAACLGVETGPVRALTVLCTVVNRLAQAGKDGAFRHNRAVRPPALRQPHPTRLTALRAPLGALSTLQQPRPQPQPPLLRNLVTGARVILFSQDLRVAEIAAVWSRCFRFYVRSTAARANLLTL